MDKKQVRLTDDQLKDCRSLATLHFEDAYKKAKSLSRISRHKLKRQRIKQVLASLREGLSVARKIPPRN